MLYIPPFLFRMITQGGDFVSVLISGVLPHSPAAKKRIHAGDELLSINGHEMADVLDYRFYVTEERLTLQLKTPKKERTVKVHLREGEELGLTFDTYLMDKQRSCRNNCVFCFIDQLPKGMRETLYFKDDDSRLSFLFGNYITLTNLTEHEIERIIAMHISPVNVSVHTTDPDLRCRMMNNRFAGESLSTLRRFADAGLSINVQLVLVPGYNDKESLSRTLEDLLAYRSALQSVAAVPVGLTKHREGLTPLRLFTPEEAADTIDRIEKVADRLEKECGDRLFYASDEWYSLANRPLPALEKYGELHQLENGVGMSALFKSEVREALNARSDGAPTAKKTIATGTLAAPLIAECVAEVKAKFPSLDAKVIPIRNDFFGESITVSGLVTGGDLIAQLKDTCPEQVLLPASMLRHEGDLFLDDVSVEDVKAALSASVRVTDGSGEDFVAALLS